MNGQVRQFAKGMSFLSPWLFGFLVFTLGPLALTRYHGRSVLEVARTGCVQ